MPAATETRVYRDLTVRAFEVRAESWDEATRSFEAVYATEAHCLVMDMQRWEVVEEILVARGCKLPRKGQVPLLDSHNRSSVKEGQLGSGREIRIEAAQVIGRNYISSTEEKVATKVKEGHVTDCSVGYQVVNSVVIEPGQTVEVGGKNYTAGVRALRVTTEWLLKEISLCPIGADEDAKVREAPEEPAGGLPAHRKEGMPMPEPNPATAGAAAALPAASAPPPEKREAPKPEVQELSEELLKRRVMAICPHDLVGVAEEHLLRRESFEQCQAAILAAYTEARKTAAGSAEPADIKRAGGAAAPKVAEIAGEVLVRSLTG